MKTVKTLNEIKDTKGHLYVQNLNQIVKIVDLRALTALHIQIPWVAYPLENGYYAATEVG